MEIVCDFVPLSVLIILLTYIMHVPAACPPGWTKDNHRPRCVKVIEDEQFYNDALLGCKSCGAELVRIENATEQDVVDTVLGQMSPKYPRYWIQMQCTSSVWKFENGDDVQWLNWDGGQPDGGGTQNCMIIMTSSLKWHDRPCDDFKGYPVGYICSREAVAAFVPTGAFFKEMPISSLNKHSVLRRYSIAKAEKRKVANACIIDCISDVYCEAVASNEVECILYMSDCTTVEPPTIKTPYKLYRKE